MKLLHNPEIQKLITHGFEIARFGIVGLSATFVHLGVAYLLAHNFDISLLLINLIAFCTAFLVSFYGHYHWTFQGQGSKRESFPKFLIIAVSGFLASTALLSLLIKFNISTDFIKLTISIFIIPVVTYTLSKTWAFRSTKG